MSENLTVGFIGVGLMGWGMAKNAVEKGLSTLVIAHRKREAVDDLVTRGAVEVSTVQEMASKADFIVLCVTGSPQVEENLDKIMETMRPGLVVIDTSTAEPTSTRMLAKKLAEKGGTFVDAPLSRTPSHAWDGELTTFVSGSDEIVEKVRPVLSTYERHNPCGRRRRHGALDQVGQQSGSYRVRVTLVRVLCNVE